MKGYWTKQWPYTETYTVEAKLRPYKLDKGRGEAEFFIVGIRSLLSFNNPIIPRKTACTFRPSVNRSLTVNMNGQLYNVTNV